MSWYKRALTITTWEPNSYYIVVDPLNLCEWKWTGIVPKGTKCSKKLPRTDIVTEGQVVVSACIPPECIKQGKLSEDVETNIFLKIGQAQSPNELLQKFHELQKEFNRKMELFKSSCITNKYKIAFNTLYAIELYSDEFTNLKNFGSTRDILNKMMELSKAFQEQSSIKKGRSYDMSNWRKIENIMTSMQNEFMLMDVSKMDFLVKSANLKPISENQLKWGDCYIVLSAEAKKMNDDIQKFKSMKWVQEFVPPFPR